MKKVYLILVVVVGLCCAVPGWTALTKLSETTLADSEDEFSRRIYSYEFDVTSKGTIHAVYSKPVIGENRAQIVYTHTAVGGGWPSEEDRTVLEEFGYVPSISTFLIADDDSDVVHICYIVERDFIDKDGLTHPQGLVYQTIEDGVVGPKVNVSSGAFHTRMQLDEEGRPMFAREYEMFIGSDGTILSPPFPKALRIQLPLTESSWTDREYVFRWESPTIAAEEYRLAGFVYDRQRGRYHVVYGDKNAILLGESYPTTNPPVTADKNPVYFPPGAGHKLWYTYSDDLENWSTSLVDPSGDISENEFWTDLILGYEGTPVVANFRYKTDAQGVQQGSTNIIGTFFDDAWEIQTVAGKTTGASPSRAGMGTKLLVDGAGRFHAVWDSSPDKPIDGESGVAGAGTTMYRFSPDGKDWTVRQVIFPFSTEGQCRLKMHDDRLLVMLLGDGHDAKLVFAEFQMPTLTDNLFEISTDKMFYAPGETINIHARIQGTGEVSSDLYVLAAGPFNVDTSGNFQALATTKFSYLGSDMLWHGFFDLSQANPFITGFYLTDFNLDLMTVVAGTGAPFDNPARYVIYSAANINGAQLGALAAPLFFYELHICSQPECGDL